MLKIDATCTADGLRVSLTGKLLAQYLGELGQIVRAASHAGLALVFDLSHVSLVDRAAVGFFTTGEGRLAKLSGCPAYLEEWFKSEGRPSGVPSTDR